MKKTVFPLVMWLLFEAIAVGLWLATGNAFYLFNFSYLGTCLGVGIYACVCAGKDARRVIQFAVGLYMLMYLGLYRRENMQLEGFWYYLFEGVFEAAVIHYAIAKLFGPLLFGRGWCGYACWTAMALDLLPFRQPKQPRKRWGWMRYVMFALSLAFVACVFLSGATNREEIMYVSLIVGNVLYYAAGIGLAFRLKDNRAFCKYLCPVTVFLKPASYFSRVRVTCDEDKCVKCGKCRQACPMEVDMLDNARSRVNGTECILCFECVRACPRKALHM